MFQQRWQKQSKAMVAAIMERQSYKSGETNKPRPGAIHSSPRISHFTVKAGQAYPQDTILLMN